MRLKILLPFQILTDAHDVLRLVVETPDGALGILPHRRDCVAALTPGVLSYATVPQGELYVAVDEGVLVKTGPDVLVSVSRAIVGTDLSQLRTAVAREFRTLDEDQRRARAIMMKLEAGFLHRLAGLQQ
jgi:F-type H+-transporting ATPase subunit epsilon